tara:strand:- start:11 stop:169 length:159 start_codon:yes stop_codon:yes gene_type:complete
MNDKKYKNKNKTVLQRIKSKLTNPKNVSPTSKYVRAVDKRNQAIQDAFGENF